MPASEPRNSVTALPLPRSQGRTVPTSSDIFKRDMISKDLKSDVLDSGGSLGGWAKQNDQNPRSTMGAMEARLSNGHTNGLSSGKEDPKHDLSDNGRYPGQEYSNGTKNDIGYGHLGKVILSPPKAGTGLGLRGEHGFIFRWTRLISCAQVGDCSAPYRSQRRQGRERSHHCSQMRSCLPCTVSPVPGGCHCQMQLRPLTSRSRGLRK